MDPGQGCLQDAKKEGFRVQGLGRSLVQLRVLGAKVVQENQDQQRYLRGKFGGVGGRSRGAQKVRVFEDAPQVGSYQAGTSVIVRFMEDR